MLLRAEAVSNVPCNDTVGCCRGLSLGLIRRVCTAYLLAFKQPKTLVPAKAQRYAMHTLRGRVSTIFLSVFLSACTVGKDYQQPELVAPNSWHSVDNSHEASPVNLNEQTWWQSFNDPVLNQLIAKAVVGNFDVKLAESRIAESRAMRDSAAAALFPVGDMMAAASRQKNLIGFPGGGASSLANQVKKPFNIFKTGFDASWELDLFGGHHRDAESAGAELEAAAISREDVVISALAEVALTYVEIRQYQAQLQLVQETVELDSKTLAINQRGFDVGKMAGIEVSKSEGQQQHDQTQTAYYSNLLAQTEYRLDVLLGEQPGMAHGLVNQPSAIPVAGNILVLAAPATVIAQRPDIRYAERKLASATAQQGVAMAKFFPDISLVGFIGLFNTNAGNLLNVGSKAWSMGGNVLWPILSYGSLSANLQNADARQQQALAKYQQSIISALADVERAVTAYTEQEKFTQSLNKAVANDVDVYDIVLKRQEQGLSSYLEVLDAKRKLLVSQNQMIAAQAKLSQNLIALYKSLGGSWKLPAFAADGD